MEEDIEVEGEWRKVKVYGKYTPQRPATEELDEDLEGDKDWTYHCGECKKSCPGFYASGEYAWKKGDWVSCPVCNQLGWKADFDNPPLNTTSFFGITPDPIFNLEQGIPLNARVTSIDRQTKTFNYSVPDSVPLVISFAEPKEQTIVIHSLATNNISFSSDFSVEPKRN